ncbi:hypothetical protein ACJ73_02564 [Blastomyces percursus]|uniref:tRNA (uracil-O(2)-)-methyltransferase n=1 Tax=Blastomyces percursus TaxID=1658174 RepID=A0A1J9RC41_9EURO|nr:hypothetical protein ACJ73_02564 [Blastomyces percursus]
MHSVKHPSSGESAITPPDMAFGATLQPSFLSDRSDSSRSWITSLQLATSGVKFSREAFLGVTTHLLSNPNINCSHVFQADILYDSAIVIQTQAGKERSYCGPPRESVDSSQTNKDGPSTMPSESFSGFCLNRTVVRRFVPRKQIDRPIEQTCHFYEGTCNVDISEVACMERRRCLVVYTPHVHLEDSIPYYHPQVRALALLYDINRSTKSESEDSGTLSIHFSPFTNGIPRLIAYRLQRTLLALVSNHVLLSRKPLAAAGPSRSQAVAPKDNLIPQHVVQNTYARLKGEYAAHLINSWVETTEPSKHVFEDILIAAFLIELWRGMYSPPNSKQASNSNEAKGNLPAFPGFVDIACGNGVLTYILLAEGYDGWGFDARRRKSWSIFPTSTQDRLKQIICIPQPFKDILKHMEGENSMLKRAQETRTDIHDGIFDKDTFIISNHADELTVWTPLLGTLSNPERPLPFLAIPCCSHSISGMRYRYPAPKPPSTKDKDLNKTYMPANKNRNNNNGHNVINGNTNSIKQHQHSEVEVESMLPTAAITAAEEKQQNSQPSTGDLEALRALKLNERMNPDCHSSMYASLTAKVIQVTREVGYGSDIDKTLLRIPSTRNVGIVGGVKGVTLMNGGGKEMEEQGLCLCLNGGDEVMKRLSNVVERECSRDGGLEVAAKLWVERSFGLREPQGRGWLKRGDGHAH